MENNLVTSMWGPPLWHSLHAITMGYPEKINDPETDYTAQEYKRFFHNLGPVLPCHWCKKNFAKNLKEIPIEQYLGSRKDLVYWLYLIHNKVNEELKKPKTSWPTFKQVYDMYNSMRTAECTENPQSDVKTCGGSINKKCRVQFISDGKNVEGFSHGMENNVFSKYWWFILVIILLIMLVIVFVIATFNKKKK